MKNNPRAEVHNKMTKIVNLYKEPYDVYIGRSKAGEPYNKWCNPYRLDNESQRGSTIERYKQHLWNQIKSGEVTKEDLLSLDGKTLGCFCKPKDCHGDVIIKAIEWVKNEEQTTN